MNDVTRILDAIEQGEPHAAEQLLPLAYDELRQLAAAKLAHERPGQTLDATALAHEAYLRLVDAETAAHWNGRGHFFAAAAEAMRRIFVENAPKKGRERRGGEFRRMPLDEAALAADMTPDDLLALDEALTALARLTAHASRCSPTAAMGSSANRPAWKSANSVAVGHSGEVMGVRTGRLRVVVSGRAVRQGAAARRNARRPRRAERVQCRRAAGRGKPPAGDRPGCATPCGIPGSRPAAGRRPGSQKSSPPR